ncbi:unnamed protein product [Clavelina lepadiformis]|uniref:XK-related protein n=1 Tax=Clavelina lepadiformis TaxID=159417 RepID=A0ABP0H2F2_CLALP
MDSNSPLLQQVLNGESEQDKTHEARAIILCSHDETDSALIRPPKLGPKPDLESFEEASEHNSEEEISQSEAASTFSFTFHALFNHKNFCKASKYTIISLCLNLAPITIYLFDFVTDWVNGFSYWNRREENKDNIFYFALTIFVIVLPAVVMHIFSACWEIEANEDKKKQENKTAGGCCFFFSMALMHILQIGPVYRYVRAAYYGLKSTSRKADLQPALHDHFYRKCHAELADVDFLRMVESFLEAGPQLVLQIYIMVTTLQTPFITVLSCCVSLFGMSTSPVAYERALRIAVQDKVQLSIIGTIVMFLYRVCNITSRVFALALLLNLHFWIWISLFVFHWFLMTLMILQQNTNFCPTKAKECFYNVIIGFFLHF